MFSSSDKPTDLSYPSDQRSNPLLSSINLSPCFRLPILPPHGLHGNDPLLTGFAGVYAVDQFAIGNRLAQRAFVQSPKLGSIGKGHESVKWRLDCLAVFKQFLAAKVKIIVSDDPVESGQYRDK